MQYTPRWLPSSCCLVVVTKDGISPSWQQLSGWSRATAAGFRGAAAPGQAAEASDWGLPAQWMFHWLWIHPVRFTPSLNLRPGSWPAGRARDCSPGLGPSATKPGWGIDIRYLYWQKDIHSLYHGYLFCYKDICGISHRYTWDSPGRRALPTVTRDSNIWREDIHDLSQFFLKIHIVYRIVNSIAYV